MPFRPLPAAAESTSRIAGFSDGVFAVAITLLVFGLQVPHLEDPSSADELASALGDLMPQITAYAQTFLIIGALWVGHRRAFRHIARDDERLAWVNLIFLMAVSFMPFPATLAGRYPENRISAILIGGSLAAVSLTYAGVWAYAAYGRLFIPGATPIARIELWTASTMSLLFLASIPMAFVDLDLARLCATSVLGVLLLSSRAYRNLAREDPPT
ncbi:MAG: DUF1211 domain-containing protein [Actinobacteria bacterium]|nr:DUF1211 domain-containing protein [Actinomycetota bacterium]